MKKIGILFLIAASFFMAGCSLFGLQNATQKGRSLLDQFDGDRDSRVQETIEPLPSAPDTRLENIPFSVIDPYKFLTGSLAAFDVLEYNDAYFEENPDSAVLEPYAGSGTVDLPFVNSATEVIANVYSDHNSFHQYYVFKDEATLDDKLALYNALCQSAEAQYGPPDEGFYHYYYPGGKDRTEDLSFNDETIKTLMAATPDGDYEFSRAWDPVGNDMRMAIAISPNVVMGHQNGDIAVFLYSYAPAAAPTPESKPESASKPTSKSAPAPTPAPLKFISGTYYPLDGGNPFLTISGTNLTIDFGDDNIWDISIEISGSTAMMYDHGKFGNASIRQIDSETIVVDNNYFGGTYTLN